MTVACILAGGRGRRMGGVQKALLTIDGRAAIDHQLAALAKRVDQVSCVLSPDMDPAPFSSRSMVCLFDDERECGPLAGLSTALGWANSRPLFALACDMPYVSPEVVELLVARGSEADLVVPLVEGRLQPLCAMYGAKMAPVVDQRLRDRQLRLAELPEAARVAGLRVELISATEIRTVDSELRSFININRPQDRI